MYHVTSGRFDLQNMGVGEALRIQEGCRAQEELPKAFSSPLFRVVVATPTGNYIIGCLGDDKMIDVKKRLVEVWKS